MPLDHKAVKPKERGVSDFYSWNMFRFLRKNPTFNRVFLGTWNNINGHNPEHPVRYIGRLDESGYFTGMRISSVITSLGRFDMMCYMMVEHHVEQWVDITDAFTVNYTQFGACYLSDFYHNFVISGDERACSRCGRVEVNKPIMVAKDQWHVKQDPMAELG